MASEIGERDVAQARRGRAARSLLRPARPGEDPRMRLPAGKVLVVMLVALSLWSVLDAQALYRSAKAAPLGARRNVAMGVTKALSEIGHYTLLDRLGRAVELALGRNPGAAPGAGSHPLVLGAPARPRPTTPSPVNPTPGVLPPLRTPTVADPLRILVIGDSFAQDLGYGLARNLDNRYSITVDGRQSTGLARLDYFDWPRQARIDVTRYRPELVFAMFGGNDDQAFLYPNGSAISFTGQPRKWDGAYRARIDQMISETTADGARLVWVGMPVMADPTFNASVVRINSIAQTTVGDTRQDVIYVDAWHLFATRNGRYTAYLKGPSGKATLVRAPDKVHLSPGGNEYLASKAMGAALDRWR